MNSRSCQRGISDFGASRSVEKASRALEALTGAALLAIGVRELLR